MVAGAGPLGRPRRRCAPVAARRPAGPGAAGQRGCLVHHSLRAGLAGLRHRGGGQLADRALHRRVELPELPLVHGAPGLSGTAGRPRRLRPPPADPGARGLAGGAPLRRGAADPAPGGLPDGGGRGAGRRPSRPAALGDHGRAAGRAAGWWCAQSSSSPRPRSRRAPCHRRSPCRPSTTSEHGTGASSPSTRGATTRSPAIAPRSPTGAPTSSRATS